MARPSFFLTTPKLPEKMGTTIGQQILSVAATVGQASFRVGRAPWIRVDHALLRTALPFCV